MEYLVPGTLVKTLITSMADQEQEYLYGVVRFREKGVPREMYFVSWRGMEGGFYDRDEVEPLAEAEKMDVIARYVMES